MPRLRQRKDGSFYIRIYRGEDSRTKETYYGTWQLSEPGEDRLRRRGPLSDDTYVPMSLFEELLKNREIWNAGSSAPTKRRTSRAGSASTGTSSRTPQQAGSRYSGSPSAYPNVSGDRIFVGGPAESSGESLMDGISDFLQGLFGVPTVRFDLHLNVQGTKWQLYLVPRTHSELGKLERYRNQQPELHVGTRPSTLQDGSGSPENLRNISIPVLTHASGNPVYLRRKNLGRTEVDKIGMVPRLRREGTIFDSGGRRLLAGTELVSGQWYKALVLNALPPHEMRTPDQNLSTRTVEGDVASFIEFRFSRKSEKVKRFLHALGCEIR